MNRRQFVSILVGACAAYRPKLWAGMRSNPCTAQRRIPDVRPLPDDMGQLYVPTAAGEDLERGDMCSFDEDGHAIKIAGPDDPVYGIAVMVDSACTSCRSGAQMRLCVAGTVIVNQADSGDLTPIFDNCARPPFRYPIEVDLTHMYPAFR
ncbi:hypothetical protein HOK31_10745 [Candidatus Poribacteria bacterium]|jgi:hypothetical protein|nr:hypothetical protein [Candidatus Poribacteria bacterium]